MIAFKFITLLLLCHCSYSFDFSGTELGKDGVAMSWELKSTSVRITVKLPTTIKWITIGLRSIPFEHNYWEDMALITIDKDSVPAVSYLKTIHVDEDNNVYESDNDLYAWAKHGRRKKGDNYYFTVKRKLLSLPTDTAVKLVWDYGAISPLGQYPDPNLFKYAQLMLSQQNSLAIAMNNANDANKSIEDNSKTGEDEDKINEEVKVIAPHSVASPSIAPPSVAPLSVETNIEIDKKPLTQEAEVSSSNEDGMNAANTDVIQSQPKPTIPITSDDTNPPFSTVSMESLSEKPAHVPALSTPVENPVKDTSTSSLHAADATEHAAQSHSNEIPSDTNINVPIDTVATTVAATMDTNLDSTSDVEPNKSLASEVIAAASDSDASKDVSATTEESSPNDSVTTTVKDVQPSVSDDVKEKPSIPVNTVRTDTARTDTVATDDTEDSVSSIGDKNSESMENRIKPLIMKPVHHNSLQKQKPVVTKIATELLEPSTRMTNLEIKAKEPVLPMKPLTADVDVVNAASKDISDARGSDENQENEEFQQGSVPKSGYKISKPVKNNVVHKPMLSNTVRKYQEVDPLVALSKQTDSTNEVKNKISSTTNKHGNCAIDPCSYSQCPTGLKCYPNYDHCTSSCGKNINSTGVKSCNCVEKTQTWYEVFKNNENTVYFGVIGFSAFFTGLIVLCLACCCAKKARKMPPRMRKSKVSFYKVNDFDSSADEEIEFLKDKENDSEDELYTSKTY